MIERLAIHRFRGIREGIIKDLGKVNLLIGPNNSGKTAILEMLYLGGLSRRPCNLILDSAGIESGAFEASTIAMKDFLGYEPLPRLRCRHGHKELWEEAPATLNQEGGLEISLRDLPLDFSMRHFRLGAPLDEPGQRDEGKFSENDVKQVSLFSLKRQKGIPADMIPRFFEKQEIRSEETSWHFLWQPEWIYISEKDGPGIDQLALWADAGGQSDSLYVLFFDFHAANSHFTDQFAKWAYKIPDWPLKISQSLGRVFPSLESAKIEIFDAPDGLKGKTGYIRFSGREPLLIDNFGDGTRHSFKVLASLIALAEVADDENPGLFLWEDPELFMHPDALGRLLNEVIYLIQDKPIQVFLSSQSLETIAWLTYHFQKSYSEMRENFRVFRMELEKGRLYAATYRYQNILIWLEQGMDPRFWGSVNLPFTCRFHAREEITTEEEL